jgi:hypothetical protein
MSAPHFCPQCGHEASGGDRFCRECGHRLDLEAAPDAPPVESEPAVQPARKTALLVVGLVALALVGAGAVLAVAGVFGGDDDSADVDPVAMKEIDELMVQRDEFFEAERRYLSASEAARRKLRTYQRDYSTWEAETKRIDDEFADEYDACFNSFDVPCPEPTYPDQPNAPKFGADTRQMRAAAGDFGELRATVTSTRPSPENDVIHEQFLAAIESYNDEASHNADIYDEAVFAAEGEDAGGLNEGKIKTLHEDSALPAIKAMNAALVARLKELDQPLSDYDVPGGRDRDASDHSNAA